MSKRVCKLKHWIVHFKKIKFMGCQLYLNKTNLRKKNWCHRKVQRTYISERETPFLDKWTLGALLSSEIICLVWLRAERFCCGKEKWRDIYQSCRLKWCIGIWRSLKHTESSLWCFLCVSNAEGELARRNWLSQSFTFLKSQSHARDALFNTVATGYMWLFCIWNVVIQIEIFYKYTKYRRFWWININ